MCNKCFEVLFSNTEFVIRKKKNGRMVAEGIRTSGNVYHVKDKSGSSCFLTQRSECW